MNTQMQRLEPIESVSKSQAVRLFDVFVLGPWLVWLGARSARRGSGFERAALVSVGLGTILYNGSNYLENQRRIRAELAEISPYLIQGGP